jgi:putative component of membrane protein insertase Oxa1/YidC/SpoIIIJ protein YidD
MRQAIERHGVPKGLWLGIKRLSKCHPFHQGGIDLVPENWRAKAHPTFKNEY